MKSQRPDLYDNNDLKLRYEAYSRLQAAAVAFGESLPIPEIVAIGGQSDGKSSLLEAFLGFRFNVREVEIGTRRPLIVQMVHDPSATEPRCRLQHEDTDEYGPPIMPETAVADAIQKRTQEHLKRLGGASVSSKPIVMRAEYAFCPNLTIIDTPGLILKANAHEADSTPDEIMNMVKAQAAPSHRLILFLQQSSVEWASSLWMHVVMEVDPNFQRTVVVASKFDNRLKEFRHQWEVDKYLSATGYLPPNVKPFFVALPKDRAITTSAEWRQQIQDVDESIFTFLREKVEGGFDEETYASRIGFSNHKRFLEEELAHRYRDAAPSTLAILQERCEAVSVQLMDAEARLQATEDVAALRRAAMQHTAALSSHIIELLDGATDPDPSQHGLTTEEERTSSCCPQWPGVERHVSVAHSELRLYGGAAFERCMEEFQSVSGALSFPSVAQNRMANVLLSVRGRNRYGGGGQAAEDIARTTAREALAPLLTAACSRLGNILRRVYDIAAERAQMTESSAESLRPFVAFHATLRSAYHSFISRLEQQTQALVKHHLSAATSEFAVHVWASEPETMMGGMDRKSSVISSEEQMRLGANWGETPPGHGASEVSSPPSPVERRGTFMAAAGNPLFQSERNSYDDVCRYAETIFQRIRHAVVHKAVPATLKSAFLDPIRMEMSTQVAMELFAQTDDDFMGMFRASGAIQAMEAKCESLRRRVEGLVKCKNEFHELARCL
ncbi:hypothetical protein BSKO_09613 [Bryopsis sp. KO-2023]|nr:hypothetical protein BSKO_09613 [Bryopsis sp. KO-2023]